MGPFITLPRPCMARSDERIISFTMYSFLSTLHSNYAMIYKKKVCIDTRIECRMSNVECRMDCGFIFYFFTSAKGHSNALSKKYIQEVKNALLAFLFYCNLASSSILVLASPLCLTLLVLMTSK